MAGGQRERPQLGASRQTCEPQATPECAPFPNAAQPRSPSPRRGAALAACGPGHLLLQGGYDGERQLADAHALHLASGVWTPLEAAGGPAGGGAPEGPAAAPRALNSLAPLAAARLAAVGGAGPSGAAVQVLDSPEAAAGASDERSRAGRL
jgi:hypothetical protein